ncbi:MAG: hypothetical protein COV75_08355 [Candidatus Omnitrophica bacterium CG11_big_fil_rev_8_21_14_0_20_63_9]|nr:MAG: hypothetical protein COV75_08355 [Candidatus Omnitrophica bacterium CG11_big_fil_rev_8_21_14_0_20_63_9]
MQIKRLFASLNLLTTALLLSVLFIMVNWVASRRYVRHDVSRIKLMALSDKSRQVLNQLKAPVHITVFYQPQHHLYQMVRDLLKEYQQATPKIEVEYVDPERDLDRANQVAQQFQIDRINMVIFAFGERHKSLSDADLAELDYDQLAMGGEPQVRTFKGEDAFTSAILGVTQPFQPMVWITTGHGEKSVEDMDDFGISDVKALLERENMKVESTSLLQRTEIPSTVNAVMIPGPTKRFTEPELLLLQAYLDRGGRVLAMVDPLQDTGLDGLLHRWGAELGMDIVVDPALRLPMVSPTNLVIMTYVRHPIVERIDVQRLITVFPGTRSVRPAAERAELTATALAMTSEAGWGETSVSASTTEAGFDEGRDVKGPVSIAVAVERSGASASRLVAIGDSELIVNAQLFNAPGNSDFILGCFHWLVGQEQLIGIGAKPLEFIRLNLTAHQLRLAFWLGVFGLPLLCGALGAGVWWRRRT